MITDRRFVHAWMIVLSALAVLNVRPVVAEETTREEDEGNAPRERIDWFYLQRSYPNGIPPGARLKAFQQARAMLAAKKRDDGIHTEARTWQQVGPTNAGGRITAVAYDGSSGKLFIGAAEGGVWRGTPNGGGFTWTPCTDTADALSMGALAIDPTNGSILYAGTGEWDANNGFFGTGSPLYSGAGILKSTDGGNSWVNKGLQQIACFSRIVINPDNPQIVYAGTNRGLQKSTDGGDTWTALVPDSSCSDVQMDPNDHSRLYIGIPGNGVYGVLDNTTPTLTRLSAGFPFADTTIGRIALSASSSGSTTVLYAVVATGGPNSYGGYKGIYKFTGFSWSSTASLSAALFPTSGKNRPQGWYDITIAANPIDPNKVIVGGVPLYFSNNGGASWSSSSIGHPDQHMIYFDPSGGGTVFVGNDGGIYVSQNNGATFNNISSGLAITQFYGIDVEPSSGGKSFGGTQDNGSWTGASSAWSNISSGDGGMTRYDPTTSSVYVEALGGGVAGGGAGTVARVTSSGAVTKVFENNDQPNDQHPWVRALAVDPSNGAVYLGSNKLYKSPAGGGAFTAISGDLTRVGTTALNTISAIGLLPGNPSIIWVGTNDGVASVTANGGTSWTNVTNGLPGRAVSRIVPVSADIAYLTESGFGPAHVLKTTNRGASWTDISSNLPDIPVSAFAIDPDNASHLFIGTDVGVLFSVDDGASWVPYMDGLPYVVVNELVVQPSTKTLFAGTFGRSTWSGKMTTPTIALGSPIYGPLWFTNQTYPIVWYGVPGATISYSTDNGATWTQIDAGQNGPTYRWDVPSGINTTTALIKVENATAKLTSTAFTIRPPAKGDVIATAARPFVPYGLAFDGYNLWATSFYERVIYKLDPDFLTIRGSIPSPANTDSCTGIAWAPDLGVLYVHRLFHDATGRPQNKIYQIDTNGVVKRTFNSPAVYPTGVAYDGTSLYAVDRDSAKIFLLDPDNGTRQATYTDPVGKSLGPRGMCFIPGSGNEFLHVVTVFSPGLTDALLYRMQIGASGFHSTDTARLSNNGGLINVRGIEKDSRYPNAYWISDFGSGTSGSIYRIVGFDVQALEVTAPTAAVVWNARSTQTITWTSSRIDSVTLELSTDNGATWNQIGGPVPASSGQYQWSIPDMPTSDKCKVRVNGAGANGLHSTSATFTILNAGVPSIAITSPAAGVVWTTGSQHAIVWSSNLVDSIGIDYSLDNGATWNSVSGTVVATAGQHAWTIPDVPTSTQSKVRLTGAPQNTVIATSQAFTIQRVSAVGEQSVSPDGFVLHQNYPNPFNPTTEIRFTVPRTGMVTIGVYDADGNLVRQPVDAQIAGGEHRVTFDASGLASGTYTYVLRAGSTELARTMMLMK